MADSVGIDYYNKFWREMPEGSVLYNLDSANHWGEYLVVVNVTAVTVGSVSTYTALLVGVKRQGDLLTPYNLRVSIAPDYAANLPFLKYVGKCNFKLFPEIDDCKLYSSLTDAYSNQGVVFWRKKKKFRKPMKRKYDNSGNPVIRGLNNN